MRLSVCLYLTLSYTRLNFPAFSFPYFYKYRIFDCIDFVLTVFVRLVTVTFSNMFGKWNVAEKSISYDFAMTIDSSYMSIIGDLEQNSLKSFAQREAQKVLLPSILNIWHQFEQPTFEFPILSETSSLVNNVWYSLKVSASDIHSFEFWTDENRWWENNRKTPNIKRSCLEIFKLLAFGG